MNLKVTITVPDFEDDLERRKERGMEFLRTRVMWDMEPVMPRKTGNFIATTQAENATWTDPSQVVVGGTFPYTLRLWRGTTPEGVPFHWTNPLTEPHWFEYTYERYGNLWAIELEREMAKDE